MVTTNNNPVGARIFVSYAHDDHDRLKRLLAALKPLEDEGLIQVRYDGYLDPGDPWEPRLEQGIEGHFSDLGMRDLNPVL